MLHVSIISHPIVLSIFVFCFTGIMAAGRKRIWAARRHFLDFFFFFSYQIKRNMKIHRRMNITIEIRIRIKIRISMDRETEQNGNIRISLKPREKRGKNI